jgi:hypothetical protein
MTTENTPKTPKAGHPKVVAALTGLATLVAVFAIFSIWANRQALNTANWVNTSGKLLQNEEVRGQLSNYLADQLFASTDVQAELEKRLPAQLQPLAGPAAGGLHQLAPQIAERALENPHVQELWGEANRAAHLTLLKILDGEGSTVSTGGGEVTLDLGTLVAQIGGQLGVGGGLAAKIPPDAGQVTILKSDQLSTAQSVAQGIRDLPIVLTLLALLLYGLAIYLAGPRRRRALRSAGFGFIVAGALALVIRGLAGDSVVGALAANQAVKPATEAVWSIGTSLPGHGRILGDRLWDPRRDRRLARRPDPAGDGAAPRGLPLHARAAGCDLCCRRPRLACLDRLGADRGLPQVDRDPALRGAVRLRHRAPAPTGAARVSRCSQRWRRRALARVAVGAIGSLRGQGRLGR